MERVFEIYIRTTPERLWEAITDPDIRSKYNFGVSVSSDWRPGSRIETVHPKADGPLGEGEVLEADPPRLLGHTMVALWDDEVRREGSSRVTWEIDPVATLAASPSPTTSCGRTPASSSTAAGP